MGKKGKGKIFLIIMLVIFGLMAVINIFYKGSSGDPSDVGVEKKDLESSKAQESNVELLIDTTQFSKISPEALIEIMGEPDSVDEWIFNKGTNLAVDTTTYAYDVDGMHYEFLVMEGIVNSLHIYAGWNGSTVDLEIGLNEDVFKLFGIQPSKDMRLVADTGVAIRWRPVNDKIAEVWALTELKSETNAPIDIQVRYDLKHFSG